MAHRNSWCTYSKWWFSSSLFVNVYQRVENRVETMMNQLTRFFGDLSEKPWRFVFHTCGIVGSTQRCWSTSRIHQADQFDIDGRDTVWISLDQAWSPGNRLQHMCFLGLPSGKRLQKTMERSTIFNGKIHYNLPFSIAMLNYQGTWFYCSISESKPSQICWFWHFAQLGATRTKGAQFMCWPTASVDLHFQR